MPRLDGEKSNASVWIVGIVLLLAVAAILYFLFARPANQPPANVNEPIPGMGESTATPAPVDDTVTPEPASDTTTPGAEMTPLPGSTPLDSVTAPMDNGVTEPMPDATMPMDNGVSGSAAPDARSTPR